MSVYTCSECSDTQCDDCNPSSDCDFCSKVVCPDCTGEVIHEDSRHRKICSICITHSSLLPTEIEDFKNSKGSFNPMQEVKGKKVSTKDFLGTLASIGE